MARLGKKPLVIPAEVKVSLEGNSVRIEGPKGKISWLLPARIKAEQKEDQLLFSCLSDTKLDRSLQGLSRAIVCNMLRGVKEGYSKELEIVGVGYRAQLQGNKLSLQLGFSHPVIFLIPEGIKIEAPKQNQIIISGIDKERVGKVAAEIRAIRPPEPYKGKGIRYSGENVKKKIGKAQAAAAK